MLAFRHFYVTWTKLIFRTHNLRKEITLDEQFTPEGCNEPVGAAVTYGAGEMWAGVYDFVQGSGYLVQLISIPMKQEELRITNDSVHTGCGRHMPNCWRCRRMDPGRRPWAFLAYLRSGC